MVLMMTLVVMSAAAAMVVSMINAATPSRVRVPAKHSQRRR